jgi:hypothetical protein
MSDYVTVGAARDYRKGAAKRVTKSQTQAQSRERVLTAASQCPPGFYIRKTTRSGGKLYFSCVPKPRGRGRAHGVATTAVAVSSARPTGVTNTKATTRGDLRIGRQGEVAVTGPIVPTPNTRPGTVIETEAGPGTVVPTNQGNVAIPGAMPAPPGTPAGTPVTMPGGGGGTVVDTPGGPVAVPEAMAPDEIDPAAPPETGPPSPPATVAEEKAIEKAKGLPTWVWVAGGAAALWFLMRRGKR